MQNPVVVMMNDDDRFFVKAKRQSVPIGEPEIKKIVKRFIKARYEWRELNPKGISKSLEPLTTSGLRQKIRKLLVDLKDNGLQGKSASQTVAGVNVIVTKKQVIAQFDKVLRVEGIPLIVPTGISLNVVKGSSTQWNPAGVYVNGIIENANK